MGNGIFNRMKTAAVKMLKPYEEGEGYDEYDEEYEEYEEYVNDEPQEVQEAEEVAYGKKNKESRNRFKSRYVEKQSASSESTGDAYGGYIDDFDEVEDKREASRYSFKTTVPPKTEYKAPVQPSETYAAPAKEPAKNSNVFQFKKPQQNPSQKFKFSIIKFEKIENAVIAADQMLAGDTVTLIDLHDMPEAMTKRVIDFLDGVRYTCNAQIEAIADLTYVILPETVELKKDFSSQVDTEGLIF